MQITAANNTKNSNGCEDDGIANGKDAWTWKGKIKHTHFTQKM